MFFAGRAGEVLGGYFGRRLAVVALVLLLFLLGVVTGAVSVGIMEQSQVDEVAAYLETFFQGFKARGSSGV